MLSERYLKRRYEEGKEEGLRAWAMEPAYVLAVETAVVVDGDGVLVERLHIRGGLALARISAGSYYTPDGAGRG